MNKRKNWRKESESLVAMDDEIEIDDELNKYEDMPLFENKMAIAKSILENSILPFCATIDSSTFSADELHEKENAYIEHCLTNKLLVPHIAQLMLMSVDVVHSRIEEIKNTAKV